MVCRAGRGPRPVFADFAEGAKHQCALLGNLHVKQTWQVAGREMVRLQTFVLDERGSGSTWSGLDQVAVICLAAWLIGLA